MVIYSRFGQVLLFIPQRWCSPFTCGQFVAMGCERCRYSLDNIPLSMPQISERPSFAKCVLSEYPYSVFYPYTYPPQSFCLSFTTWKVQSIRKTLFYNSSITRGFEIKSLGNANFQKNKPHDLAHSLS